MTVEELFSNLIGQLDDATYTLVRAGAEFSMRKSLREALIQAKQYGKMSKSPTITIHMNTPDELAIPPELIVRLWRRLGME